MMNEQTAKEIKVRSLQAIESLTSLVIGAENQCDEGDFETIKKACGVCIGRIEVDILARVYRHFPEMDDLES